jgi:ATP/maltotriose-dependent transcriptional regulator MalT
LAVLENSKDAHGILYGQVENMAMEAACKYQLRDREGALQALCEAYRLAEPNALIMPFIYLGTGMRTLSAAALKEKDFPIPKPWLENIKRRSATYAKRRAFVEQAYRKEYNLGEAVQLADREAAVLKDLYHGLSRTEIAAANGLSINTVKSMISMIYTKLGVENNLDAIRVAMDRRLI